jgi:hypothetical protein
VGLRIELSRSEAPNSGRQPELHPTWVLAKLERLDELIGHDVARARIELRKHLDGDLTVSPRPSVKGERRAEVVGRVKANSLLERQEAVRLSVVAGAGFEPATFGL